MVLQVGPDCCCELLLRAGHDCHCGVLSLSALLEMLDSTWAAKALSPACRSL